MGDARSLEAHGSTVHINEKVWYAGSNQCTCMAFKPQFSVLSIRKPTIKRMSTYSQTLIPKYDFYGLFCKRS